MARWKRGLISFVVTIAIVLVVVLIPSQASALNIAISGPITADKPSVLCLTATLTFQAGELIPISNLEALISGATAVTIEFDPDGNVINVTGDLDASHVGASISRMEDYSYGYGYRTGYQSGYGYDFGYGYGYYAADTVVRYVICINTKYLTPGDHDVQVRVNTGEAVAESFNSSTHAFHLDGETINLSVVYNNVPWQRPAANFSTIGSMIPLASLEVLTIWDSVNQSWTTYTHPSWGHPSHVVNPGDAIWINVNTSKSFEM